MIASSRPIGSRIEPRSLRGLDELRAAYRTWVGTWSTYEAGHSEIFDLGGGRFYLPTWERSRGKGSGVEVANGGTGSGTMPPGLLQGTQAQQVAAFVSQSAGQ